MGDRYYLGVAEARAEGWRWTKRGWRKLIKRKLRK